MQKVHNSSKNGSAVNSIKAVKLVVLQKADYINLHNENESVENKVSETRTD